MSDRRESKQRSIIDDMRPTLIEYIKMASPKRAAAFAEAEKDRSRLDFADIDVTVDSLVGAGAAADIRTPVPVSPIRQQFEDSKREMRMLLDSLRQKRTTRGADALPPRQMSFADDSISAGGEGDMVYERYVPSKESSAERRRLNPGASYHSRVGSFFGTFPGKGMPAENEEPEEREEYEV